jgi:DNA-binding CsgD family transcriptional regulator
MRANLVTAPERDNGLRTPPTAGLSRAAGSVTVVLMGARPGAAQRASRPATTSKAGSGTRMPIAAATHRPARIGTTTLDRARRENGIDRLTPRQLEVLSLMAEGRSNGAIAQRLVLTVKAVVKHVSHIYDELGLQERREDHRRVLAVVCYLAAADEVKRAAPTDGRAGRAAPSPNGEPPQATAA